MPLLYLLMMNIEKNLFFLMTMSSVLSNCYKILFHPMPSNSHVYSHYYIGRELIRSGGHEVHLLLHWSYRIPDEWLEEKEKTGKLFFHVYGNQSSEPSFDAGKKLQQMTMDMLSKNLGPEYLVIKMKQFNVLLERDFILESDQLMAHLESLKMDAIILDYAFFIKHQVYAAHRLKLPVITYWDVVEPWLIRTPWMPSINAPLNGVTDTSNNFQARLINFCNQILVLLKPPFDDAEDTSLAKFRQHGEFENPEAIVSNSLLFLVTQDPVLDFVRPFTSNVVLVGGLTTEDLWTSNKTLPPQEFLDFIENDPHVGPASLGTVIISFGSLVLKYSEKLASILLLAFSRLPQYKFIWKFHNHLNLSIPKNVKTAQWIPQKELLGHPSVKLFITHSGNNGQFEAVYFGVPMLAVYLLSDQPKNARRVAEKGYGIELDFRKIHPDELVNSIKKVITEPVYKERIQKASKIYRSRPDTPAQRAAFWIEHVLTFGGDYLKPVGNDLTFWEYLCLDVLVFMEFITVVLMILFSISFHKMVKSIR